MCWGPYKKMGRQLFFHARNTIYNTNLLISGWGVGELSPFFESSHFMLIDIMFSTEYFISLKKTIDFYSFKYHPLISGRDHRYYTFILGRRAHPLKLNLQHSTSTWRYCWSINLCLSIYISKLVTVVEGDQKGPFSIATTPRCRGRCYSFPWIAPFYPWYIPYTAEC